jgi:ATP/maltotriose-dependent transcriptional regulator MalT
MMFWTEGIAFGGIGFLKSKNDPALQIPQEHLQSLQRVLESSFKTHPYVQELRRAEQFRRLGLSQRERQVVTMISSGASNQDIAESMGITLGTVKTYVVRIFEKLNVKSRTAVVAFADKLVKSNS